MEGRALVVPNAIAEQGRARECCAHLIQGRELAFNPVSARRMRNYGLGQVNVHVDRHNARASHSDALAELNAWLV